MPQKQQQFERFLYNDYLLTNWWGFLSTKINCFSNMFNLKYKIYFRVCLYFLWKYSFSFYTLTSITCSYHFIHLTLNENNFLYAEKLKDCNKVAKTFRIIITTISFLQDLNFRAKAFFPIIYRDFHWNMKQAQASFSFSFFGKMI